MRKILVPFLLTLSLLCYPEEEAVEEKGEDISQITTKISEIESNIKKMSDEIKKMKEEMEKINMDIKILYKTVRDLQIYTQGGASIKPDEDEWKSIKRGMSKDDVEEILGTPEEVSLLRGGGEVWYYYGLGSITFNRDGLVVSQESFKEYPLQRR